jgi:hypothetical protein
MGGVMNVQIDFYSSKEASVTIGSDDGDADHNPGALDVMLLACFILRNFVNSGRNTQTDNLARLLTSGDYLEI